MPPQHRKPPHGALDVATWVLFCLSGILSLIYQVTWTRLLRELLGSTAHSVAAVLAAYMSGMALGGLLLGRLADTRRNGLALFGALEALTGVAALAVPQLVVLVGRLLLVGWTAAPPVLLRYAAALCCLLVPTTLMGGTLPALARAASTRGQATDGTISRLYAVNTLGAAAGAAIAGFALIRLVGVSSSNLVAALGSLAVGGTALALSRRALKGEVELPPGPSPASATAAAALPADRLGSAALVAALGLSGAVSFCYEVCWTRALVGVFGSSTYAFSAVLAVLLLGLATGAAILRRALPRVRDPLLLFGRIEILLGASAALLYLCLTALFFTPAVQQLYLDRPLPWPILLLLQLGASAATLFLPSVLLGATFPLIAEIQARIDARVGRRIGGLAAANTAGNVVGALAASLLLIPGVGITRTLVGASAVAALVGAAVLLCSRRPMRRRLDLSALAAAAAMVALAAVLSLRPGSFQFPSDTQQAGDRVLYYREGPEATTKVYEKQDSDEKHMSVDGTYIGGSGGTEQKELILAHLPKLLLPRFDTELSIGLGSGILAGEAALHPELRELTCVEIEPTVVEGARLFARENAHLFDNPRVRVLVDDGISYLRRLRDPLSIISSDEKSRPRSKGNGLFVSADYYRLIASALEPDGLTIQWIPLHMPPAVFRTILRTFCAELPFVSLWYFSDMDAFLVGSREPLEIDVDRVGRRLGSSDGADPYASLRRYGISDAASVASAFVAAREQIQAVVGAGPVNSLEHPVVEFYSFSDYAPSTNAMIAENLELVLALREAAVRPAELVTRDPALEEACTRAREAMDRVLEALALAYGLSRDSADIDALCAAAVAEAPDAARVRYSVAHYDIVRARARIASGDATAASRYLQHATTVYPEGGDGWYLRSYLENQGGRTQSALALAQEAAQRSPRSLQTRRTLFYLLLAQERLEEAVRELRAMLAIDVDSVFALRNLGLYEAEKRSDPAASLPYFRRALELQPQDPQLRGFLAWWSYQAGETREAVLVVREGGGYYRGNQVLTAQRAIIMGAREPGPPAPANRVITEPSP